MDHAFDVPKKLSQHPKSYLYIYSHIIFKEFYVLRLRLINFCEGL